MTKKCIFTRSYNIDEIQDVVYQLQRYSNDVAAITLLGPLGAGKTTFVSHLLRSYGVVQDIISPTFTYVNIYNNDDGKTFYHFDLYRIGTLDEFISAGFEEYLYQQNSLALIEWPTVIMPLLDHNVCHISLDYGTDIHYRHIRVEYKP